MAGDSVRLSKNLMRMKFMVRCLDVETKKQLEEDEKKIISDEHWYLDLPDLTTMENVIVEEKSFVPCEDLRYGRMSFKGFNPEVEKLMALLNPKDEGEEEEEGDGGQMQMDVTDEEMALRYEDLVGSMRKKFAKKRDKERTEEDNTVMEPKRIFMKPQD
ncbi:M-phase phosphoprotein 6-like [Gouania willdenowi]|uniref:M-phase phosphoprotein 6-like n=1 Tax=Gouania willdenowi TaxID=441366 RepID=UPI001056166F|nr:M-phase phosphoprotein 6-like [Gouania willdenowi]